MPDLQSELKAKLNGINFDDAPGEAAPATSENYTRSIYEFVEQNPGITSTKIRTYFATLGLDAGGVSTRLSQLTRRGVIKRTHSSKKGYLYSVSDKEYDRRLFASKVAPVAKPGVQTLLDTLSIVTARALYDELRKIFDPQPVRSGVADEPTSSNRNTHRENHGSVGY